MGNCIDCRFCGFMNGELSCVRNSPMAHVESCTDCDSIIVHTIQPSVQPSEWCGEYHPAPISQVDQTRRTYEEIQREIEDYTRASLSQRDRQADGENKVVTLRSVKPKGNA